MVLIQKILSLLKTNKLSSFSLSALLFAFLFISFREHELSTNDKVISYVESAIDYQISLLKKLKETNVLEKKDSAIKIYKEARCFYKNSEFYLEYHFPFYSKYFINGALVNKADYEYGFKTFVPHGYQVIESYIFDTDEFNSANFKYEIDLLIETLNSIKLRLKNRINSNSAIIDMLRFEIVRITSLYLNGYDSTIEKNNLNETIIILKSLSAICHLLDDARANNTDNLINVCKDYIQKNNDYDKFNRLVFIRNYLKPLYSNLHEYYTFSERNELTQYAINIRSKHLFDKDWINQTFFKNDKVDSSKVKVQIELGKLLFFDPILSGNNKRACASCHQVDKSFASNERFNKQFNFAGSLNLNTPSLINVALQKLFFHDGKSRQLEEQVHTVLNNHSEMNTTPQEIISKLKMSTDYKLLFNKAFANTEDSAITYFGVIKSLTEFERTLIDLDLPIDNYLAGDSKALNKNQIEGYTLFSGKALCGSCHFFPLFNGLVPPFYSDNEFEVIGTAKEKDNTTLALDSGRFLISKNPIHLHAIKTPGIRNFKYTAPYMHNGAYKTIDEVIDFYIKGGGAGFKLDVPNQTLPFDSLKLSKMEKKQLKSFLLSLNKPFKKINAPKKLPFIKEYNNRKVGGVY